MIHTDFYKTREDGVKLYRTYSDEYLIQKDGTDELYTEAIDVENSGNTYAETDLPIEPDADVTLDDALDMLSQLGVETDEEK